jgi:hypothetical protein
MDLSRENDIERLRQAALILDAENKRLVQQLTEVMRELSKALSLLLGPGAALRAAA